MDATPMKKLERLQRALAGLPGALVAYSGGADSAFLAEVAHRALAGRSEAVTADSPSLPRRELAAACDLAAERGWRHLVVGTAELADGRYVANPVDRCSYCKGALMDVLAPLAAERGHPVLLGTNCDDLGDWRPGQAAAASRGALSPLVEAGFTKQEVRAASAGLGLRTAGKPAAACLSSRIAYGVPVTIHALARIEAAEDELLEMGFRKVRVRDLGEGRARVEVGPDQLDKLAPAAARIERRLLDLGFAEVHIDPRGYRRGALNEGVVLQIGPSRG